MVNTEKWSLGCVYKLSYRNPHCNTTHYYMEDLCNINKFWRPNKLFRLWAYGVLWCLPQGALKTLQWHALTVKDRNTVSQVIPIFAWAPWEDPRSWLLSFFFDDTLPILLLPCRNVWVCKKRHLQVSWRNWNTAHMEVENRDITDYAVIFCIALTTWELLFPNVMWWFI